ncbi:MAG: hypothetical protein RL092_1464, partial [Bacteroidota bacterium]
MKIKLSTIETELLKTSNLTGIVSLNITIDVNCSLDLIQYNMKKIFFIFSLLLTLNTTSQIVINEGSNKNYTTIADEDGEFEDWIELYNSGNMPVDLYNFNLTDDLNKPSM